MVFQRMMICPSARAALVTVHYEAKRAGLDPEMVLGLIEVESGFRKYAVSSATAMGYMQIMPFWTKVIGSKDHNLFHLRTNLRYGVTILRHYIDIERGDLFRALGRYNGSLGKPEYPNLVSGLGAVAGAAAARRLLAGTESAAAAVDTPGHRTRQQLHLPRVDHADPGLLYGGRGARMVGQRAQFNAGAC
jgi:soluble lytic murein transglycosylase-like protein